MGAPIALAAAPVRLRRVLRGIAMSAALVVAASVVNATPLRMDYCVRPVAGGFEYTFELILDNNDGSWLAGQGFGWIIFGDINGASAPPSRPSTASS